MACCDGTTSRRQVQALGSSKKEGAPLFAAAAGPLSLCAGDCVGAALGLGDGQRLQHRLCTPAQHAERQLMPFRAPQICWPGVYIYQNRDKACMISASNAS